MSKPAEPYRILFVCTANICRSPAAEALARNRFGEREALFRSAGFLDEGLECPQHMVDTMRDRGIDISGHRSYRLDEASLEAADLVLTMEGEHVQKATLLHQESFSKIIPLTEASEHLATGAPGPQPLPEFLEAVNRLRDPATYLSARWDVADPYRRKLKDYRNAVTQIAGLVDGVIGRLS